MSRFPSATARYVHAYSYHDAKVPSMLSIAYLLAYEGGRVEPGDDMLGSSYRWWSLDAIERSVPF